MTKIIIAAVVVSVVILVECGMAYMLIPSSADIQARASGGETPAAAKKEEAHGDDHGGHGDAHAKKEENKEAHGHAAEKKEAHGSSHGSAKPSSHGSAKASHGSGHGSSHGSSDPDSEVEKDLGKFYVVVHQPATNVTLRINFHLIASALEINDHELDALLKKNEHRLRDQVIFEVRNSDVADLTDPGLGLIKRKILAKSNELLGQPLLTAVYFSEFAFIEQ